MASGREMDMGMEPYADRKWCQGLDGPALRIAASTASPLRVAAGPGTGKTYALMRRVARLLEEGADPKRILVITFTRTGARAITSELSKQEVEGAPEIISSTLHSHCFRTLAQASVFGFTGRVARTLIEFEEWFLRQDLKRPGERTMNDCEAMIKAFNAAWARLQHEQPSWPVDPKDRAFHQDLMDWLRFHEAMLLGELPTLLLTYLRQNPATPERRAFDHILVDEYQDLNRADQILIDILSESGTLTVIGDEDQSIYGRLRHAQPEGIRDFATYHQNTQSESLEVCRRCPPQVVATANQLISVNRDRELRTLQPMDPNRQGFVRVVQWSTMEEEVRGIATFVKLYLDRHLDVKPRDVLVLSPRRVHGKLLKKQLDVEGVPAISYFFEDAFKHKDAQQRYMLLSLIVKPNDRVSLRCWLGFDHGSAAIIPYANLRRHCEENSVTPIQAMQAVEAEQLRFSGSDRFLKRWRQLHQERVAIENLVGQAFIDAIFPASLEGTEELRLIATTLQERSEEGVTPKEVYEAIQERIINPEPPEVDNYVRVMSAYKAKGLTVKLAILAGTIHTWVPTVDENLTGDEQRRQEEEQRRLLYVALTRPTDALVVSSFRSMPSATVYGTQAKALQHRQGRGIGLASQFIEEMGAAAPQAVLGEVLLDEMTELSGAA